ncbi:MAG: metal ABC transporter ATP-binding protein [Sulfolobales archaeon]|jgi:ABC-type Mn2+/Zn2+ transport system ATPase subunit
MYAVEARNIYVSLGGSTVLENVSFSLEHPSVLVIMGPNGGGKTTLLRTIAGIIRRDRGVLKVFGVDPEKNQDSIRDIISYMPQISYLNLGIPLRVREIVSTSQVLRGEERDLVDRALQITGLEEYADKYFHELSGGLRQRVLVARALAKRAKLLLLDEPLSMVDISSRESIIDLLFNIVRRENMSTIVVSHDISHCLKYDPYVLLLNRVLIGFGKASEVITIENLSKMYGLAYIGEKTFFLGEEHGPRHH